MFIIHKLNYFKFDSTTVIELFHNTNSSSRNIQLRYCVCAIIYYRILQYKYYVSDEVRNKNITVNFFLLSIFLHLSIFINLGRTHSVNLKSYKHFFREK